MPQFTAFALVAESDLTFKLFQSETFFIEDIRFAIFYSLVEAEFWMKAVLSNEGES